MRSRLGLVSRGVSGGAGSWRSVPRMSASACRGAHSETAPEEIEQRYIMPTYATKGVRTKEGLVFESGKGALIWDEKGNEYVDFGAGIAVTVLGHADEDWANAVKDQMSKLAHTSNLYHNRPSLDLAERLVSLSPGMGKVFFSNSGTEANEGALKFARVVQNARGESARDRFVGFRQSFHGRSLGALSLTYKPSIREPFKPLLVPNVTHTCFNCIPGLQKSMGPDVAAVIVEPVQGEGGISPASREFLQAARDLCDQHGALLIFDEVQIGLGRQGNGRLWGYEEYGVIPDFVTMAKPLANGLPIGAVMVSEKICDSMEDKSWLGTHGSTFAANPLVTRAAGVVLDKITQPTFKERVKENGKHLIKGLEAIRDKSEGRIREVRRPLGDAALYAGLQLASSSVPAVIKHCLENKVMVLGAGDTGQVVRLCPPLVTTKKQIDIALDAIEKAIMECVPIPTEKELITFNKSQGKCDECPALPKEEASHAFSVECPEPNGLASDSKEEYEQKLEEMGHAKLPEGFRVGTASFTFFPEELPKTETTSPASMKLSLIVPEKPTTSYAGMYTQNAFPGAPVKVSREISASKKPVGALVMNNKISNVHPRKGGVEDAKLICSKTAELLGLSSDAAVLPSSTGVIGWRLPVQGIIDALPSVVDAMQSDSVLPAAKAIMTTDTFPKTRSVTIKNSSGNELGRVTGIAKGAGMIEPNMATMLVYLLTDIDASAEVLDDALRKGVNTEGSFNRISVDADQSTSDSIVLVSSGKKAKLPEDFEKEALRAAVSRVCSELAQDVVRNGEGTQHVIKCTVRNAPTNALAHGIAKAVVNSPLCKTGIAGNDPNLGRIIAAVGSYVGKVSPSLTRTIAEKCTIHVGDELVFHNGEFDLDSNKEVLLTKYLEDAQLPTGNHFPKHYKTVDITIEIDPSAKYGHESIVYGSDLTDTYVKVNAGYRS